MVHTRQGSNVEPTSGFLLSQDDAPHTALGLYKHSNFRLLSRKLLPMTTPKRFYIDNLEFNRNEMKV